MSKILVSIDNLDALPNADGYVLGYEKYTFFSKKRFSYIDIKNFPNQEKLYLLLNVMLHENELDDFKIEASKLAKLNVNFIVQDLGMVEVLSTLVDKSRIIYNPYTLVCNLYEYQTYYEYLKVDIGVSSQLSIDNLEKYVDHSFITIYGYTPIYQSYRKVISLFSTHHHTSAPKEALLKEDTRDNLHHILENEYGSIIFSSEPVNLLSDINRLKNAKYLFIDTNYVSNEKVDEILKGLNR